MDYFDEQEKELAEALEAGEISNNEYKKGLKELRAEYKQAFAEGY